jgi:hypothetical protein
MDSLCWSCKYSEILGQCNAIETDMKINTSGVFECNKYLERGKIDEMDKKKEGI